MNEAEHDFPLPETEKHKLDDLKQEIQREHPQQSGAVNGWFIIVCALAAGLACGALLGRPRRKSE